jgi:hypothetical protein
VRIQAAEFGQQNTNPLGALGDFQIEKFLDGQAIAEIVGKRIEVVDAVGEWDDLLVELGLTGFLDPCVEIANFRSNAGDHFAIDFHHQTQHAVCGRMLRTHVEDHAPRI